MAPKADGLADTEGYRDYLRVSLFPVDGDQLVLAAAEANLLGVFNVFSKPLQPLLDLRPTCAHLVPIDAELACNLGFRESFLNIACAGG